MSNTISYDKFDEMSAKMAELKNIKWFPSMKDVSLISHSGPELFMSLICFLTETHTPKDEEEKKIISVLNKAILKSVEFTEEEEEDPPKYEITYDHYCNVFTLASRAAEQKTFKWFPTKKQIDEYIKPYIRYSFAFVVFLLYTHADRPSRQEEKAYLRSLLAENFCIVERNRVVSLSQEEYEYMRSRTKESPHKRGEWMPTMYDVKRYIEPNFQKCYDFVYWILTTNRHVESEKEREVYNYLIELFNKRVILSIKQEKMTKILSLPEKDQEKDLFL